MTRKGKWTSKAAQRYLEYKDLLQMYMLEHIDTSQKAFKPGEALRVVIVFKMPIPDSTSAKKRESLLYTNHVKKPDIDNLIKSVFDASNGILWVDDNQIASVAATKFYAPIPGIEIQIARVEGEQQ